MNETISKYKIDSVNITNNYQKCIKSVDYSKNECEFWYKYFLDSIKLVLNNKIEDICCKSDRYTGNKPYFILQSPMECDIDYNRNNDFFDYYEMNEKDKILTAKYEKFCENISFNPNFGFKTTCKSDGCINLLLVMTKDSVIHVLNDYDFFKKELFPINSIQKALFLLNYSNLFCNDYRLSEFIPSEKVKYKKIKNYFYIEHVYFLKK